MEKEVRYARQRPNTRWTTEVMTGAILALKEAGQPVNVKYLELNHRSLASGIHNYPGGWGKIVELAGFNPAEETKSNFKNRGIRDLYDLIFNP